MQGIARLAWAAWLAAGLMLAGCASSTVPNRQAETQPAPPPVAPVAPAIPEEPEPISPRDAYQFALVPPPGEWPVTRAALLLPLSGRHGSIGQAMLNAAQLALFDVADERFALVVRDTGGTPHGARLAMQSALEERVGVVLGPLFAGSTRAVAEETRLLGINLLSFSNDRSVAGDGVFIAGLPPRGQVERVVDYAIRYGVSRFAVFAPQTTYGTTVVGALEDAVVARGGELVRIVSFNPAANDLTPELRVLAQYDERHQALLEERAKLEASGDDEAAKMALKRLENLDTLGKPDFDAVLLPLGGRSLLSVAPSLAYFDVDPVEIHYLGTALWDDPSLGTEPSLVGGWFAAPPPALWDGFRARYEQTYGSAPPRVATLAYDLVALSAVMARTTAGTGLPADFGVAALTQPSGFAGVDGIFRFTADGVVERGLAILEMERNQLRELEAAPQSFEAFFN